MIALFITPLLFLILGVVLIGGRGAWLIAGYNTAKKSVRARYDEKALCRFMGKCMFAVAFETLLWALGILSGRMWIFFAGAALFAATVVFMLVWANTGGRFLKKES